MLAVLFIILLALAAPASGNVLPGPDDNAITCDPGTARDGVWLPTLQGSPALYGLTVIFDTKHDRFVLFGGLPASSNIWTRPGDLATPWQLLTTSGVGPGPRAYHSAIYDQVLDRMIICGGNSVGTRYTDAWELSFASDPPRWSLINPFGEAPAGRRGHQAMYDGVRRRMLVFGGVANGVVDGVTNETWELTLDGPPVWTRRYPSPQVTRRDQHCAAYDSKRDRWIIAGGMGYGTQNPQLLDVEAIDLTTFHVERLPDLPGGVLSGTLTYDPKGDRLLLFGGWFSPGAVLELPLYEGGGGWRTLVTADGSVTAGRRELGACLDPARNRLLFVGGTNGSFPTVTDVIAFGRDADVEVDPGRFHGPISSSSKRPISLVLHGTDGLHAREIDPLTVRVGLAQVDTRRGGAVLGDVDGDGQDDLSFEVVAAEIGVGPSATSVAFSAKTLAGDPVCGTIALPGGGGIDPFPTALGRIHLVSEVRVAIELRDVRGRIVARTEVPGPVDGYVDPAGGRALPPGVYWARVVGSPNRAIKVVRLR